MKKKEKISLEKAKVLSILNSSKPIFENYIIQGIPRKVLILKD